jgi:hypothetical protein
MRGIVFPNCDCCHVYLHTGVSFPLLPTSAVFTGRSAGAIQPFTPLYGSLSPSTTWNVRVTAKNAKGYGSPSLATSVTTPAFAVLPSAPVSVSMFDEGTGSTLGLFYQPSVRHGGSPVTQYRIEVDTSGAFLPSAADYRLIDINLVIQYAYAHQLQCTACFGMCVRMRYAELDQV